MRLLTRTTRSVAPTEAGERLLQAARPGVAAMPFPALQSELAAVFQQVSRRIASGAPNAPQPRSPFRGKGGRAKRSGGAA